MNSKIFVVDDEPDVLNLAKIVLERAGHKVVTASNGIEAEEKIPSEQPDLILLDVVMPKKNGFEVCKEIRKTYNIPIIMLTARGEVTDRIVGLELGADDISPNHLSPGNW